MKNRWTLLLFGAPLFVLFTGMQMPPSQMNNSDLKVEITPLEDLRLQLSAQNQTGKTLQVSLWMQDANIYNHITETEIYSEHFAGTIPEIYRTLNLSKLETGTYRLNVKAGKSQYDRILDIRTKPIVNPDDTRIILFK